MENCVYEYCDYLAWQQSRGMSEKTAREFWQIEQEMGFDSDFVKEMEARKEEKEAEDKRRKVQVTFQGDGWKVNYSGRAGDVDSFRNFLSQAEFAFGFHIYRLAFEKAEAV